MDGYDVLRAVVRWLHAVAAVVWVGGSIFYLAVVRPSIGGGAPSEAMRSLELSINRHFRDLVDLSIIVLILTGVFITFDRLDNASVGALYFVVLALKLASFAAMAVLARDLGTRLGRRLRAWRRSSAVHASRPPATGWRMWLSPPVVILVLGLIAFFLSMLLVHIYENAVSAL